MRRQLLALLLASCGGIEQTDLMADERTDGQVIWCSDVEPSFFYSEATRFDVDYTPTTPAMLAATAQVIVRAQTVSVREGADTSPAPTVSGTQPSTIFELRVNTVYKGNAQLEERVFLQVARDGNVIPAHLAELSKRPPSQDLTFFLVEAPGSARPTTIPKGARLFVLPSPQGAIVSTTCGTRQLFETTPLFDRNLASEDEVDEAVRALVAAL